VSVDYTQFIESKVPLATKRGMNRIPAMSSHLFGFQKHCVQFSLEVGSGGLFLDTGLGKTLVQLEYAEHARQAANGKALILTPLAVAKQIEREGKRFGYDARVIRDQSEAREGINICNYDRLHLLDPSRFGVVTLDEASILKSFGGKTSRALIDAFADHRWRMPATATPAPNDHMEMGQYADFCGIMHSNEMLSRFFINDTAQASQKWRLKRYGVDAFWNWVASWCRLAQLPIRPGRRRCRLCFAANPDYPASRGRIRADNDGRLIRR
jgi:SNF2 family DNA or RNA helicase